MSFMTLPNAPRLRLENATMPACLLGKDGALARGGLTLEGGRIVDGPADQVLDLAGAMVLPCFTDMHTHIDKGHIWARAPNPDGTFMGALETVGKDRVANWSADDLRARMSFSLKCSYAHGTRALRTHLDSLAPQDDISWPVFRELREEWAGRIDIQAACLMGVDALENDEAFLYTADLVAASGGVLGVVLYPVPDIDARLDLFFKAALDRDLAVDFHVDETLDPSSMTLRSVSEAVLRHKFQCSVVVGHCCSLSAQDMDTADRTMDMVAEAGLSVVSLPMCNMYLQSREAEMTPRMRGVTLVHELKARGVPVAFSSDNSRDPFYAYGDMDMVEVMREATRIAHLDHSHDDWVKSFTTIPSQACGFDVQTLETGQPADLVICRARTWNELFSRPQHDRIVLREGVQIDRALPDYSELDHLMELA